MDRDDRPIAQLGEDLALLSNAVAALGVGGDLQDAPLIVGIADEQRDGRRAAPEPLHDLEPREEVTRLGSKRRNLIGPVSFVRGGQFLLDKRDAVDEVGHRGGAVVRVGSCRVAHQGGEVLPGAVQDGGNLEATVAL